VRGCLVYGSTAQYATIMYQDSTSAGYPVHIDYAKMYVPPPPRFEEIFKLMECETFGTAGSKQKKKKEKTGNINASWDEP